MERARSLSSSSADSWSLVEEDFGTTGIVDSSMEDSDLEQQQQQTQRDGGNGEEGSTKRQLESELENMPESSGAKPEMEALDSISSLITTLPMDLSSALLPLNHLLLVRTPASSSIVTPNGAILSPEQSAHALASTSSTGLCSSTESLELLSPPPAPKSPPIESTFTFLKDPKLRISFSSSCESKEAEEDDTRMMPIPMPTAKNDFMVADDIVGMERNFAVEYQQQQMMPFNEESSDLPDEAPTENFESENGAAAAICEEEEVEKELEEAAVQEYQSAERAPEVLLEDLDGNEENGLFEEEENNEKIDQDQDEVDKEKAKINVIIREAEEQLEISERQIEEKEEENGVKREEEDAKSGCFAESKEEIAVVVREEAEDKEQKQLAKQAHQQQKEQQLDLELNVLTVLDKQNDAENVGGDVDANELLLVKADDSATANAVVIQKHSSVDSTKCAIQIEKIQEENDGVDDGTSHTLASNDVDSMAPLQEHQPILQPLATIFDVVESSAVSPSEMAGGWTDLSSSTSFSMSFSSSFTSSVGNGVDEEEEQQQFGDFSLASGSGAEESANKSGNTATAATASMVAVDVDPSMRVARRLDQLSEQLLAAESPAQWHHPQLLTNFIGTLRKSAAEFGGGGGGTTTADRIINILIVAMLLTSLSSMTILHIIEYSWMGGHHDCANDGLASSSPPASFPSSCQHQKSPQQQQQQQFVVPPFSPPSAAFLPPGLAPKISRQFSHANSRALMEAAKWNMEELRQCREELAETRLAYEHKAKLLHYVRFKEWEQAALLTELRRELDQARMALAAGRVDEQGKMLEVPPPPSHVLIRLLDLEMGGQEEEPTAAKYGKTTAAARKQQQMWRRRKAALDRRMMKEQEGGGGQEEHQEKATNSEAVSQDQQPYLPMRHHSSIPPPKTYPPPNAFLLPPPPSIWPEPPPTAGGAIAHFLDVFYETSHLAPPPLASRSGKAEKNVTDGKGEEEQEEEHREHQRYTSTSLQFPTCRDGVDDDGHELLQQRPQGPVPPPFASDSSREEGRQQQAESSAEANRNNADFSNAEEVPKNCAEKGEEGKEEEKIENQNANADEKGTAEEEENEEEEGGFFVGTGKLLLANLLRHNYKELPLLLLNNLSTHQGRAQMLGTVRRAWMARLNRTIERTAGVLSAATKLMVAENFGKNLFKSTVKQWMSDVERKGTAALSTTVSSLLQILGAADGGGGGRDGEKEEQGNNVEPIRGDEFAENHQQNEKKASLEVGKNKNVLEKQQPKSGRGGRDWQLQRAILRAQLRRATTARTNGQFSRWLFERAALRKHRREEQEQQENREQQQDEADMEADWLFVRQQMRAKLRHDALEQQQETPTDWLFVRQRLREKARKRAWKKQQHRDAGKYWKKAQKAEEKMAKNEEENEEEAKEEKANRHDDGKQHFDTDWWQEKFQKGWKSVKTTARMANAKLKENIARWCEEQQEKAEEKMPKNDGAEKEDEANWNDDEDGNQHFGTDWWQEKFHDGWKSVKKSVKTTARMANAKLKENIASWCGLQ